MMWLCDKCREPGRNEVSTHVESKLDNVLKMLEGLLEELINCGFEESVWCTYKGANDESVLIGCLYKVLTHHWKIQMKCFNY